MHYEKLVAIIISDDRFIHCQQCPIRECTIEKGYSGCHQCDEFSCEHIDNFPMAVGKKVILRAIPYWREDGVEKWKPHLIYKGHNSINHDYRQFVF